MKMKMAQPLFDKPTLLRIGIAGVFLALLGVAVLVLLPARSPGGSPTVPTSTGTAVSFAFTQPLPRALALDARKVALGQRLFYDARLSKDDTVSCASCHSLDTGGVDNRARSVGVAGGVSTINAPTVYNSGLNFVQFWDGRVPSLESQIDGPVNHPQEMASSWPQVLTKIESDASYADLFAELYPQGITVAAVKDALATFERSLITPDSRFDQFLRGDAKALNAQEQRGYALFQSYGCASCHQGQNLGGNMFEKMGLMGDYFAERGGELTDADKGRFNVTGKPQNLHEFRVPSLRNVALTAPYFHDGHAQTLEQAVAIMAKYQLGRPMPSDDLLDITAFLRSLTGQYQGSPL